MLCNHQQLYICLYCMCITVCIISCVIIIIITQAAFKHPKEAKALGPVQTAEISDMLRMHANTKLLQDQLIKDTGKIVLLKDLHNVRIKTAQTNDALFIA